MNNKNPTARGNVLVRTVGQIGRGAIRQADHVYVEYVARSRILAHRFSFQRPAVLLMAYARSGSSWAGQLLGSSPDLAYLREPVNRALYLINDPLSDTEPLEVEATLERHHELVEDAFAGIPPSGCPGVILQLRDFLPRGRKRRRVLIKEVVPLATDFYVRHYDPQVVLLLRHPAGIMASRLKLKWLKGELEASAYLYGVQMRKAIAACREESMLVVRYEDLVADPAEGCRRVWTFLGVSPPANLDELVQEYSHAEWVNGDPYETKRTSSIEATKWKTELTRDEIETIKRGYWRSGLDYYRDDTDWPDWGPG